MNRQKIVDVLDEYFEPQEDNSWNGLQFEGKEEVQKVLFAVTFGLEVAEYAAEYGFDMIICHHGEFWKGADPGIKRGRKERLALLTKHDISLYACHLPLDAHKEVGNNAELLRILGAEPETEFFSNKGKFVSWLGNVAPVTIEEITETLKEKLQHDHKVLPFGPEHIKKIAVCTGGGGYKGIHEALAAGADLFITGDTAEIYHVAKDEKIHVIFAGHHATELLGVTALSEKIKRTMELKVEVLDIPTKL